MTSQQRVQAYIEKHRISALFEDLMARLTHHLPADPVPFLIKVLNKFDEKAKKPGVSTKDKKSSTWAAASFDSSFKALSGMGNDRGYERPWTSNMRKYDSRIGQVTSLKKPHISPVGRKPLSKTASAGDGKGPKKPSRGYKHSQEDLLYMSPSGVSRPPPQEAAKVEEQFLQEEMSATKLTKKNKGEDKFAPKEITAEAVKERHQRPGNKAKKHKQELAQMVEAQLKCESLGYLDTGDDDGDPDSGGYEEATDMLEDASDLMDEGVIGVKSTGKKSRRRAGPAESEVKLTMCSKCARLVGSDDSSTTMANGGYGKYTDIDSFSEVSGADFTSGRMTSHQAQSDDDFESVSQVSGPRHPVWHDDSSDHGEGAKDNLSENGGGGTFRLGQRSDAGTTNVGQGWDPVSHGSDTEVTSREINRGESQLGGGRTWAQPDSDDDSSY